MLLHLITCNDIWKCDISRHYAATTNITSEMNNDSEYVFLLTTIKVKHCQINKKAVVFLWTTTPGLVFEISLLQFYRQKFEVDEVNIIDLAGGNQHCTIRDIFHKLNLSNSTIVIVKPHSFNSHLEPCKISVQVTNITGEHELFFPRTPILWAAKGLFEAIKLTVRKILFTGKPRAQQTQHESRIPVGKHQDQARLHVITF